MSEKHAAIGSLDVLIVEDSATQALKLQHMLEQHEHRVVAARDGIEALKKLGGRPPPDLVITDVNMPNMDGYALCERIKDDPRLANVPVILLTSLSDPKDILKGLGCGADNFIVKPYEEEFLLARIEHVLANRELRSQPGNGNGDGTEVFYGGERYRLSGGRTHSIDLLLSTYETAVQKNLELSEAKQLLENQAGVLRERNSQIEADLDMARELQTAFLPQRYPVFPAGCTADDSAVRFCHRYRTTTELGGDFFDILRISDTEVGIFICDVMGHGVRAALVTAIIRGLEQELAPFTGDAAQFLTEMNRGLCAILKQTATPLFASAFYGVLDVGTGELRHANAGHPNPFLLRRAKGTLERVAQEGLKPGSALGVFPESRYAMGAHRMGAGDLLVLFTDGLYEIEGRGGELFTQERLGDLLAESREAEPAAMLDEVIRRVLEFSVDGKFDDDVCLVGVELMGKGTALKG